MSALCCAAPSLNLMAAPSSMPVYHFGRPMPHPQHSFLPMELNQYARIQHDQFYNQQQPTYVMPHQQHQQVSRARRKRLEDALTEAIPSASRGKVSQRIAQLQQSLYASCATPPTPGRMPAPRPLSLDPCKDYSQPLSVDCSIEYDLPRVARPPPGAKPLLLIARRPQPLPAHTQSPLPPQQQQWSHQQMFQSHHHHQFVMRPDCAGYSVAPVISSSSSEDSGRGTDSERASSPAYSFGRGGVQLTGWMPACMPRSHQLIPQQQQQQQFKLNHVSRTAIRDPQHPRAAEAVRARGLLEPSACQCCPSRPSQVPAQRWAPYSTAARHACPAPVMQQPHHDNWALRWNESTTLDHLLPPTTMSSSSSSLMAFHI